MRKYTYESNSKILFHLSPLFVFSLMIDATVQPFFSQEQDQDRSKMTVYEEVNSGINERKRKVQNPFFAIKNERGKVNSKLAASELLRCEILKFYSKNIHSHSSSSTFFAPCNLFLMACGKAKVYFLFFKRGF